MLSQKLRLFRSTGLGSDPSKSMICSPHTVLLSFSLAHSFPHFQNRPLCYTGYQSLLSPFTLHTPNCVLRPLCTCSTARQPPSGLHGGPWLQTHAYPDPQLWGSCKSLLPLTSREHWVWIAPAGNTKEQTKMKKDESRLWHGFAPLLSLLGVTR